MHVTVEERALVVLSAAIANGVSESLDAAIDEAASLVPVQAEEAILQSYLFLGYPAALQTLARWRERTGLAPPSEPMNDTHEWAERGESICATVYAGQYDRLRANIKALHPDVERWMLIEGYGKVLGRPALTLRMRELCIVALLAGQNARTQLYAHVRGALNAGASEDDVEATLEATTSLRTADHNAAAFETWAAVRSRRSGTRQL